MSDNISAVATPAGAGGIAVIRISGDSALEVLNKMFAPVTKLPVLQFEPYRMYPGEVTAGEIKDQALCVYFKKPHSFTGEDTVEIHCHGGLAVTSAILRKTTELGCRAATRGEFTKRAFLNGKLSLASCEGLINIISSESSAQLKAAYSLYREKLTERTRKIQGVLTSVLAEIDANIDFPEDGVPAYQLDSIKEKLTLCHLAVQKIADTYSSGRRIKNGVSVAIAGRPNTGKSSLLNAFLNAEKAIVSDIAGTTRDIVEGTVIISGVKFDFSDTAGIRESADNLERMGIERSKKMLDSADIIILVLDASAPLTEEDFNLEKSLEGKDKIVVYNKCDLKSIIKTGGIDVLISAKTGAGIAELKELLYKKAVGTIDTGADMLVEERHYNAFSSAAQSLDGAVSAVDVMPLDIIAVDIKAAWESLGEISGLTASEHIINEIFSKFCVGK